MIFARHKHLDDRIVEMLVQEPLAIKTLHERLQNQVPGVSLRGVYKAVDALLDSGVLIKAGKRVRADQEWVRDARTGLLQAAVSPLAPGEHLSYAFVSIAHLDAFWKTIVFQLEEYERDGQVFFYNPHNFWASVPERAESEAAYYRHFAQSKLHAFFTVGGDTPADKEFKRSYQNDYLQIDARNMPSLGRTAHVTVLGDHVVTVRLPKRLASEIDAIYDGGQSLADIRPDIAQAYKSPSKIRFVLENNPVKARKLKKSLSTNFYFWKSGSN